MNNVVINKVNPNRSSESYRFHKHDQNKKVCSLILQIVLFMKNDHLKVWIKIEVHVVIFFLIAWSFNNIDLWTRPTSCNLVHIIACVSVLCISSCT